MKAFRDERTAKTFPLRAPIQMRSDGIRSARSTQSLQRFGGEFVAAICLSEVGELSVVGNGQKGSVGLESREKVDGKIKAPTSSRALVWLISELTRAIENGMPSLFPKSAGISTLLAPSIGLLGLFRMLEDWTAREKGPPSVGRMWLDQFRFLRPAEHPIAIHFLQNINAINDPSAIRRLAAVERSCLIVLLQYDNHMS